MLKFLTIAAFGAVAFMTACHPAPAQEVLDLRVPGTCVVEKTVESLSKYLAEKFGEVEIAHAMTASGEAVVLTVDPNYGGWTIYTRRPPNLVCALSAGTDWEFLIPPKPAPVEGQMN